jgi:hypothetical protein
LVGSWLACMEANALAYFVEVKNNYNIETLLVAVSSAMNSLS